MKELIKNIIYKEFIEKESLCDYSKYNLRDYQHLMVNRWKEDHNNKMRE